jgi:osomolarity two-component system response regulator SSK1
MFTSMKNLNYMSAHLAAFWSEPPDPHQPSELLPNSSTFTDFDVGEMLQNVGDALSGVAAQADVDLVLFHGDVGVKHMAVRGNESGLSYALSYVSVMRYTFDPITSKALYSGC